jgi:hypothetical protein
LERPNFKCEIPEHFEQLKDIQIKFPLVEVKSIQAVYDIIRHPKVVEDLVRLAFPVKEH